MLSVVPKDATVLAITPKAVIELTKPAMESVQAMSTEVLLTLHLLRATQC